MRQVSRSGLTGTAPFAVALGKASRRTGNQKHVGYFSIREAGEFSHFDGLALGRQINTSA